MATIHRKSGTVNDLVRPAGGTEADEAFLLNGLVVLGVPPETVAAFSDRDPRRRYLADAVVRALGSEQVTRDQVRRAIAIGRAIVGEGSVSERMRPVAEAFGIDWKRYLDEAYRLAGMGGRREPTPDQWVAALRAGDLRGQLKGDWVGNFTRGLTGERAFPPKAQAPPPPPARGAAPAPARRVLPGDVRQADRAPAPTGGGEIPAGVPTDPAGVMNLQRLLNERGAGLAVDGKYGPKTRAAHQTYGRGGTVAPAARSGTLGGTLGETFAPAAGGPVTGGAAPPPLAADASDAEVEAYIRRNYGFAAWVLEVPDIRGAIVDVARSLGGVPMDEATIDSMLENRLLNTEWWKTHSATQRVRLEERHEDPAQYNKGVETEYRNLGVLAGQIGVDVPEGRLREIARQAYDFGWDQAEQRAALAAEFDYNPDTGSQATSKVVGDLRQRAGQYLVPLSEATIDEWGRKVVAGTASPDAIDGYLKEQAKVLLPGFAAQIDAGLTPDALVEPYRQTIARELGTDPTAVDFLDPKWNRFLNTPDAKTNAPRVMSHFEIQRTIRSDPTYRWDESDVAQKEATEFATQLAERFGRAG